VVAADNVLLALPLLLFLLFGFFRDEKKVFPRIKIVTLSENKPREREGAARTRIYIFVIAQKL
jgi:hypothetical protein